MLWIIGYQVYCLSSIAKVNLKRNIYGYLFINSFVNCSNKYTEICLRTTSVSCEKYRLFASLNVYAAWKIITSSYKAAHNRLSTNWNWPQTKWFAKCHRHVSTKDCTILGEKTAISRPSNFNNRTFFFANYWRMNLRRDPSFVRK